MTGTQRSKAVPYGPDPRAILTHRIIVDNNNYSSSHDHMTAHEAAKQTSAPDGTDGHSLEHMNLTKE